MSAAPGDEVIDVPTTRPPAASKALRLTCQTGECDSLAPDSAFWMLKPIGVGSKVWRRRPVLNRAPGCSTLRASGSASELPAAPASLEAPVLAASVVKATCPT